VYRIIANLKLTFGAAKPPPSYYLRAGRAHGGPEISLVTTKGSIKITKYGFPKIRGAENAHTPGDPFHPQGQGGHPGDPAAAGST